MSLGRIAVFLVFAGGVLGSLHYYVWARLVRDAQLPAPWASVASWTIFGFALLLVLSMPGSFLLPRSVSAPFVWGAFVWLGLWFFVVVLAVTTDLGQGLAKIARVAIGGSALDPARRLGLKRVIAGALAVLSLGLGAAALGEGLGEVRVKKIRIALRRLRKGRIGYRIVQLSDVHVGPTIGRAFIERIVAQTNALAPDLIVITGDLVDGSVALLRDAVAPLAGLKAKDGVYFVTGNHEYYSGVEEWLAHLPSLGIRVLHNERVVIGEGLDVRSSSRGSTTGAR